jgi:hypothetical protein
MAGYSGTPLPQKLGIRPGARLRFVAAPDESSNSLGTLPAGVRFAPRGAADVVVFFTVRRAELQRRFEPVHVIELERAECGRAFESRCR